MLDETAIDYEVQSLNTMEMTRTPTQKNDVTSARLTLEAPVSTAARNTLLLQLVHIPIPVCSLAQGFEQRSIRGATFSPYERSSEFPQRETVSDQITR